MLCTERQYSGPEDQRRREGRAALPAFTPIEEYSRAVASDGAAPPVAVPARQIKIRVRRQLKGGRQTLSWVRAARSVVSDRHRPAPDTSDRRWNSRVSKDLQP